MPEYQSRLDLLARVASLYYDKDRNQQEIADEIGLTRSAISRLLTEAHKRGIVEHIIHYPWRTSSELENALLTRFHLRQVHVFIRQNKSYEEMLQGLGVLAAEYLTARLSSINIVGISWGTGLYQMVRAFRPQNRPDMEVVQLDRRDRHGARLVDRPAAGAEPGQRLGCTCHYLHAPLLMENEDAKNTLMQDRMIRDTLDKAAECDIGLVGIGSTLPELYNAYKLGYLPLEEVEAMRADGIVGDVACLHFNKDGKILTDHWINRRMCAIPAETLGKMKEVVAVAGGSKKAESILAALHGELIDTLITDDEAARRVLEIQSQNNGS